MSKTARSLLNWADRILSEEDDPDEPHFDPVHLGGAVVVTLTAIGCLYWLLWTLLVYEGGIFLKLYALARLAGGTPLKQLGWEGWPYAMGDFDGIVGNFVALALCAVVFVAVRRLYADAAGKKASKR